MTLSPSGVVRSPRKVTDKLWASLFCPADPCPVWFRLPRKVTDCGHRFFASQTLVGTALRSWTVSGTLVAYQVIGTFCTTRGPQAAYGKPMMSTPPPDP